LSWRGIIGRASLIGLLALFVAWLLFLRPLFLGGPTGYIIVTGSSMEPWQHGGDLVISMTHSSYTVGDAVVYRIPAGRDLSGRLIVHRILAGDATSGYKLKGDNAQSSDPWTVGAGDIVGRVDYLIPMGGRIMIFLRNPWILASLAAGFAFVLVVWPTPRRPPEGSDGDAAPEGVVYPINY
jgi:signal peptidase I